MKHMPFEGLGSVDPNFIANLFSNPVFWVILLLVVIYCNLCWNRMSPKEKDTFRKNFKDETDKPLYDRNK